MTVVLYKQAQIEATKAIVQLINDRHGEEIFKTTPEWWIRPLRVEYHDGDDYGTIQEAIWVPTQAHTWDGNWRAIEPVKAKTLKIESFMLTAPEEEEIDEDDGPWNDCSCELCR